MSDEDIKLTIELIEDLFYEIDYYEEMKARYRDSGRKYHEREYQSLIEKDKKKLKNFENLYPDEYLIAKLRQNL